VTIEFHSPRLAETLDAASQDEINGLPFGAVRLSKTGVVEFYSTREQELSGFGRSAVGLNWFREVAPCMDNPIIRGRIEIATALGPVDIVVEHVGLFGDPKARVELRVVETLDRRGYWLVLRKP
jgi:photoactive yellow protein